MRLLISAIVLFSVACNSEESANCCDPGEACQPLPRCGPGTALQDGVCIALKTLETASEGTEPHSSQKSTPLPTPPTDVAERLDGPPILEMPLGETPFGLREKPSRDQIKDGIKAIYGRVAMCGDKHSAAGSTVKVKMRIGADGLVHSVVNINDDGGDSALQNCVIEAVKQATFPETEKGMLVTYPFAFR